MIGGGAIGLCCAIELANRGARVVLVERGLPGGANSTLTGGGIRQQFGTATNIAMSLLAASAWAAFADRFGVDPGFRPIGYLFLASDTSDADTPRTQVDLQQSLGAQIGGARVPPDSGFVAPYLFMWRYQQFMWRNYFFMACFVCYMARHLFLWRNNGAKTTT